MSRTGGQELESNIRDQRILALQCLQDVDTKVIGTALEFQWKSSQTLIWEDTERCNAVRLTEWVQWILFLKSQIKF